MDTKRKQELLRDTGYAPERWSFDEEVSRVFDDMLDRSIPQYETMREAVTLVGSAYVRSFQSVLDLGCSTGTALERIRSYGFESVVWYGLESSPSMLARARERFADADDVAILNWDLKRGLPPTILSASAGLILSVLTLMFVPVNYRQTLLEICADRLVDGGALVLVEKTLGATGRTDDLFTANYHRKKKESGYTPDEIERKRLSLEGVLVPLKAEWTEEMLRAAGFRSVDTFWSWMNFRGWVAVR